MFLQMGLDRKIDQVSDLPGGRLRRAENHVLLLTRLSATGRERAGSRSRASSRLHGQCARGFGARQIVLRRSSAIGHHGHCLLGREFAINNANAIGMVTPILHPLALTEF
jgi:hypothetical protein